MKEKQKTKIIKTPFVFCLVGTLPTVLREDQIGSNQRKVESENDSPFIGRRGHWFSAGYGTPETKFTAKNCLMRNKKKIV